MSRAGFLLVAVLIFFQKTESVYAFDLSPKTKYQQELAKNWTRTQVVTSIGNGFKTQAQMFVRRVRIGNETFSVASMTVFELQKKGLKAGDPDTINIGLGFLLGFDDWHKHEIAPNTYRYVGYDKRNHKFMQVLWKEEIDRFLYAIAYVEGEVKTPIAYEVELLQRQLLKKSKSFADYFQIFPYAEAKTVLPKKNNDTVTKKGFLGSDAELRNLVQNLNAPEEEFSLLYRDIRDVRSSLGQAPANLMPSNPGEVSTISEDAFKESFTFNAQAWAMKIGTYAAGASVAPPLAAAGILYENADALYKFLKKKFSDEDKNLALLEASKEAHQSYLTAASMNSKAIPFRDSLIKLKFALNRLGINDLKGDTIGNRIQTYKDFIKAVEKLKTEQKLVTCVNEVARLNTLIINLEKILPFEESGAIKNLNICGSIGNLNKVIRINLQRKSKARNVWMRAFTPILDKVEAKLKEEEQLNKEAQELAVKNNEKAALLAQETLAKKRQEFNDRQDGRIEICMKEKKKSHSACFDDDMRGNAIGIKEWHEVNEAEEKLKKLEKKAKRSAVRASEPGAFDNSLSNLEVLTELVDFQDQLLNEKCYEPGGKCADDLDEEEYGKVVEYLQKEKKTKAQIEKICPELKE